MKEISRNTDFFLGKKKNRTERNLCRNIFPFEKKYCTTLFSFQEENWTDFVHNHDN